MVKPPTGTVTMVFSDIEGSTGLLSRLGSAYAEALTGQRQILRKAWNAHSGREMGTEGDSFFVVFTNVPAAVHAATRSDFGNLFPTASTSCPWLRQPART